LARCRRRIAADYQGLAFAAGRRRSNRDHRRILDLGGNRSAAPFGYLQTTALRACSTRSAVLYRRRNACLAAPVFAVLDRDRRASRIDAQRPGTARSNAASRMRTCAAWRVPRDYRLDLRAAPAATGRASCT
jgi:hypothetical protein